MNRKELHERYIALAAAMMEARPYVSEAQYHRMKRSRTSPGFYLVLQWESCVQSLCRALHRLDATFNPDQWLAASGYITTPKQRTH
jgi:hypothetical protein